MIPYTSVSYMLMLNIFNGKLHMNKMLVCDYIIVNYDRHYRILRQSEMPGEKQIINIKK